MTSFGPRYWDVSWAPFLLVGIFVFLLLLGAVPRTRYSRRPRSRHEAAEQVTAAREEEAVVATAFGCSSNHSIRFSTLKTLLIRGDHQMLRIQKWL